VTPAAWRALAFVLVLGLVGSWFVASRLRRRRNSRVDVQILAAAVLGGIPAVAIFSVAWVLPGGAHVIGLAFGCGVGGILGTAGAWSVRDRHDSCPRPLVALLATFVGATIGSALGAAMVAAVLVSDGQLVGELMLPLAAAYVGSSAALGFQIGAG
jgi:hypothetical protein